MEPNHQMKGKVCLVTGATSGIGMVAAAALAAMGAEVVITGRDHEKAEAALKQIRSQTNRQAVNYLLADFSDLDQVRDLAAEFNSHYSQLDVLVNNAGTFHNSRKRTEYGVERTFLVNHLAPFLLTNLLIDKIQYSQPARIINVSSEAHKYGTLNFDDLEFEQGYAGMKAYARSKLANILFTYELARRMPGKEITVNALHPGHVATDIWKTNFSVFGPLFKWVMGLFALTPEQGADNTIYLASSPEVARESGKYFIKREPVQSSPTTYNLEIAERLWQVSEELTLIYQAYPAAQQQKIHQNQEHSYGP
jgi:NAD(P)-dependent dehydrogenase (short-subunit alcohol dehydrogenase family)